MLKYDPVKFDREGISKVKVMREREKIYQKFVRVGHFIFSILDKLEIFSRKKNVLNEAEKPKVSTYFSKSEKGYQKIKLKARLGVRIPIGIHNSARVKKYSISISVKLQRFFNLKRVGALKC